MNTSTVRDVIKQRLTADDALRSQIIKDIFSTQFFYVPAAIGTTPESFSLLSYAPYSENGALYLFAQRDDANALADAKDITDNVYAPLVAKVRTSNILDIISKCLEAGSIDRVRIFVSSPIYIDIEKEYFVASAAPTEITSEFRFVDNAKAVLNAKTRRERDRYLNSGKVLNAHELLSVLLAENRISYQEFDRLMDFNEGFTENFCADIGGNSIKKEALVKILSYFELEEYLLRYKKYCSELEKEIQNSSIDQYSLRPARLSATEAFKLVAIKTGRFGKAKIYRLELESARRKFNVITSSIVDCIEGENYEIEGLKPEEPERNEVEPIAADDISAKTEALRNKFKVEEGLWD